MPTHLQLDTAPIILQPHDAHVVVLPLSLDQLLADGLQHFPPREAALEQAIATTEDALMPQVAALRAQPLDRLVLSDASLAALADLLARPHTGADWHVDEVERAFNLVADVAAGLPAHRIGLPEHPRFVAALLVVRELMHHVGWETLQLPPPG